MDNHMEMWIYAVHWNKYLLKVQNYYSNSFNCSLLRDSPPKNKKLSLMLFLHAFLSPAEHKK